MPKGGWRVDTTGLSETIRQLEAVTNVIPIQKMAIYDSADVVAEEMRKQVKALKTSKNFSKGDKKRYALPEDKKALEDALGITKMRADEDAVNAKVGFDGYFNGRTHKAIPLQKVANSINSGTSFMYAQPFIKRTIKACEPLCIKAMSGAFDRAFKNLLKK